jgi:hypothetical protein
MRLGIAVLLLAWASTAGAQQIIWKCKGPKGTSVFQNAPCAPGQALQGAKVYDTPDRPEAIAERQRHETEMDRRNASLYASSNNFTTSNSLPSARDRQKERCALARQAASDAARAGLSYQQREGYERAVVDACFGL